MADEEVVGAASPPTSDHKRKLEDLEPESYEAPTADSNGNSESPDNGVVPPDSEAKRPRLEEKPADASEFAVSENGHQEEKEEEPKDEVPEETAVEKDAAEAQNGEEQVDGAAEPINNEEPSANTEDTGAAEQPFHENPVTENAGEAAKEEEKEEPKDGAAVAPQDASKQGDVKHQTASGGSQLLSRKMEVPSNKVGVLIGKAGDTIRTLQHNSGARIQITRDADADPYSTTRPVELIGSLDNINKAEKLIKDVIAEADAGGSPSLVARGFNTVQSSGPGDRIEIKVPNEKVGLIIGKGGETIKSMQTRSGARIQLIPQHLPEGDQSKDRTVRVSGDRKQIDMAREMIYEAMNQPIRSSAPSGGYGQQGFRPRGPGPQWGPRGHHPSQPTGYDYPQRGPYPSQHPQYPSPTYGNYPPQQHPPRGSYGWEQRPPTSMQGPHEHTGGYDYYGGQGGHSSGQSAQPMHSGPAMGPPPSQANYNYGQPQGPDYGQLNPYPQSAPPQSYGHGYNETKYENQGPAQHPYGGHGSQPSTYPQGTTHPGYAQQEQYGKPPAYNMPQQQQGPYAQPYGQPRTGEVTYQGGPVASTQSYGGPNVAPTQQPYPYASGGPTPQSYPPYGSVPVSDGYSNAAQAQVYPQQGGQPVSGYAQAGVQQAPAGYGQAVPTAGYGQYPSGQPGFAEQQAAGMNNPTAVGYGGYQGAATDTGYGAPPAGQQPVYSQPAATQPGYDQSQVPYGSAPLVAYGKSVSPQPQSQPQAQPQAQPQPQAQAQAGYPQYDASQMYGGHR